MATTVIKGAIKVYIARENILNTATPYSGTGLHHYAQISIADTTTTRKYFLISTPNAVSVGSFGKTYDTYDSVSDPYSHDIEIRYDGSGSVDLIVSDDNTANTTWDHLLLNGLALEFPNGWNENNVGATAGSWNPFVDSFVTQLTDTRGYAIVIEQKIDHATPEYLFWVFHNCKISSSLSFNPKQATKGTLSWEDARYVEFVKKANAITVGTSVHSDTAGLVFA